VERSRGVAEKSRMGREWWRKLREEKFSERGAMQVGKQNKRKDTTMEYSQVK